jgi:hypothetical protein
MSGEDLLFVQFVEAVLDSKMTVEQVQKLEPLRGRLMRVRVGLWKELVLSREKLRMPNYKPDPKDKDTPRYTDFDRNTMLNAAVAELEADYELVKSLEQLVKERIEVIKWLFKPVSN